MGGLIDRDVVTLRILGRWEDEERRLPLEVK